MKKTRKNHFIFRTLLLWWLLFALIWNPSQGKADQKIPVMLDNHTTWVLQKDNENFVVELSGLCLSMNDDFLWGVGDNGDIYRIGFDGTYERNGFSSEIKKNTQFDRIDMEGVAMDKSTMQMYVCVEPNEVYKIKFPYEAAVFHFRFSEAAGLGNLGLEGIAWHRDELYLCSQTGCFLWKVTPDGKQVLGRKSLKDIAPEMTEIADAQYDEMSDRLWVLDSNFVGKDRFPTIYLFTGDANALLSSYSLKNMAVSNPEAICVDRKNSCIWIGEDCGWRKPSILHKVEFSGL